MYEEDFKPHDTVGGIIKNTNGDILVLYHHKYDLYTIPIGKSIKGETPTESLIREFKEELGIDCKEVNVLTASHIKYTLSNIDIVSVGILFEVLQYDGTISNIEPDKHSDLKFVSLDELNKLKQDNKLTELTKVYLDLISNE